MSRPVLFVLDDDPGVVRALHSDLSRRFSRDFRVLGESSAAAGLTTLRRLARRDEPVALLIVDHDMTETPGLEFLARAHGLHPAAKRVLLVERDYSARSPVVQAMTLGQADYYLSKPWMLEPDLYQGVSEFLAEWARDREAAFDLFHVIGALQDRGTNELRELLIRFNVPFRFSAADSPPGRRLLREKGLDPARLPVMIRHDGYTMVEPTPGRIVEVVGGPCTQWLPEAVQLEGGYILTGRDIVRDGAHPSRWPLDRAPLPLETSVPGVFAAGDARYRSIKRVASAVGDGATAVRIAHEYLAADGA